MPSNGSARATTMQTTTPADLTNPARRRGPRPFHPVRIAPGVKMAVGLARAAGPRSVRGLVDVAHGESDEEQHREVIALRAAHAERELLDEVLRHAVDRVDAQLRLPSV